MRYSTVVTEKAKVPLHRDEPQINADKRRSWFRSAFIRVKLRLFRTSKRWWNKGVIEAERRRESGRGRAHAGAHPEVDGAD